MRISSKEISAILALPGNVRFKHFIKTVADRQEVWGLDDDGWALAGTDTGERVLPFWPAPEYAELCAVDGWSEYRPARLDLDEFFDLLAQLEEDGIFPFVKR